MRSVLSLGSWLMLRTLSMRIASLLTVFVVARFGTEHTAAYQLGMGVFNLFLYALDSLAIAAQALLGKELGERDLNVESERAKVRQLKNRLLRMSLIYGVITGLICPLIGFFGSWIFTQDAQVAFLFTIATVIIALGQPIAAYVFALDGILMGAQDVKYLAIGCFIMLVMYVPVMLGPALGGRRRCHGCARRVLRLVGRVYSVLPGNPRGHFRSPRPLGCVDESRCLNPSSLIASNIRALGVTRHISYRRHPPQV